MIARFGSIVLMLCMNGVAEAAPVRIYAAASLTLPINEIVDAYQKQNPNIKIISVYAASSTLAKQIESGAVTDIFFSADQEWMNYLAKKNKVSRSTIQPHLKNSLVVVGLRSKQYTFKADTKFNFAQSFQGRLCTGQMESVPVGKYAKEGLIYFNWFNNLKTRIVGTDHTLSTLKFVERGGCSLGIVYRTDALLNHKLKIVGVFPESSHRPIIYPIAMTSQGVANRDARQFFNFLKVDSQALKIYRKYGFHIWK